MTVPASGSSSRVVGSARVARPKPRLDVENAPGPEDRAEGELQRQRDRQADGEFPGHQLHDSVTGDTRRGQRRARIDEPQRQADGNEEADGQRQAEKRKGLRESECRREPQRHQQRRL